MEIADVMMIEEKEVIFFTQGSDYVAPPLMESGGVEATTLGLPAIVGAYKVRSVIFRMLKHDDFWFLVHVCSRK